MIGTNANISIRKTIQNNLANPVRQRPGKEHRHWNNINAHGELEHFMHHINRNNAGLQAPLSSSATRYIKENSIDYSENYLHRENQNSGATKRTGSPSFAANYPADVQEKFHAGPINSDQSNIMQTPAWAKQLTTGVQNYLANLSPGMAEYFKGMDLSSFVLVPPKDNNGSYAVCFSPPEGKNFPNGKTACLPSDVSCGLPLNTKIYVLPDVTFAQAWLPKELLKNGADLNAMLKCNLVTLSEVHRDPKQVPLSSHAGTDATRQQIGELPAQLVKQPVSKNTTKAQQQLPLSKFEAKASQVSTSPPRDWIENLSTSNRSSLETFRQQLITSLKEQFNHSSVEISAEFTNLKSLINSPQKHLLKDLVGIPQTAQELKKLQEASHPMHLDIRIKDPDGVEQQMQLDNFLSKEECDLLIQKGLWIGVSRSPLPGSESKSPSNLLQKEAQDSDLESVSTRASTDASPKSVSSRRSSFSDRISERNGNLASDSEAENKLLPPSRKLSTLSMSSEETLYPNSDSESEISSTSFSRRPSFSVISDEEVDQATADSDSESVLMAASPQRRPSVRPELRDSHSSFEGIQQSMRRIGSPVPQRSIPDQTIMRRGSPVPRPEVFYPSPDLYEFSERSLSQAHFGREQYSDSDFSDREAHFARNRYRDSDASREIRAGSQAPLRMRPGDWSYPYGDNR